MVLKLLKQCMHMMASVRAVKSLWGVHTSPGGVYLVLVGVPAAALTFLSAPLATASENFIANGIY